MARQIGISAMRIAKALELRGEQADHEWAFIAALLEHQGVEPNWRSRSSILDQLRGWRLSPGKPRSARAATPKPQTLN